MPEIASEQQGGVGDEQANLVRRPGRGRGIAGLLLGIFSLVFLGICVVPGIIVSYTGLRSLAPAAALIGYVLTWIACLFWSWVLFSLTLGLGMIPLSFGNQFDGVLERSIADTVVAIRAYQVSHDNALPDNETGTRILEGTVQHALESTGLFRTTSPPETSWSLHYERLENDTWRASLVIAGIDEKHKGQSQTIAYDFNAAGDLLGGHQSMSHSRKRTD